MPGLRQSHRNTGTRSSVYQNYAPSMKHIDDSALISIEELMRELQQRTLRKTTWFGVPALQSVTDFWTYQEIIYERQPDYLVELGNLAGGSTCIRPPVRSAGKGAGYRPGSQPQVAQPAGARALSHQPPGGRRLRAV